jgi:hypothetical protein
MFVKSVVRVVVVVMSVLVLLVTSSGLYNIDPIKTMNSSEMQHNDENTIIHLCFTSADVTSRRLPNHSATTRNPWATRAG